jgi:hypothetical protein
MSFRTMEERHIVVGEEIPTDLVIADSDDQTDDSNNR